MPGGRPKTPTIIKELQGTNRPDRNVENEALPAEVTESIKPPSYLRPIAKKEWKRVLPILEAVHLLTHADLGMLEIYCMSYGIMVESYKGTTHRIEEDGTKKRQTAAEYCSGRNSQTQGAMGNMYKAQEKMIATATKLGLSPADRGKINVPPPKDEESEIEKFKKKGKGLKVVK